MRIALGVEYEGWGYQGFQRQRETGATVQGRLEAALSAIANQAVEISCAGRTDAGVSATSQVVHFDTSSVRPDRAWVVGTNSKLPPDIAVTWAREVGEGFHARFSARSRRYRYILQNTRHRPGILSRGVSVYHGEYDLGRMQEAARPLLGEHDFSSFCGADDESRSRCRCVHFLTISRVGDYLVFDIAANAFLNHMVRNLVGSLLLVGAGEREVGWMGEILEARDRNLAGPTAHPQGLYLVGVTYDPSHGLPGPALGPLWLGSFDLCAPKA
ncbi:MAG: tRNA pseudouridine(38-40) synthase TruA [Succinivibrionaceae bacterium]|nr:tRNA pseudouridine(38-40) synthase TruA [Succinivibrionaceae bacterium]